MANDSSEGPRVQSLARGLSVLLAVAEGNGSLGAKDLSEKVGISRQTTYHLLHTLREGGFVEKGADQRYSLGLAVHALVEGFRDQLQPPAPMVDKLKELAATTGETCSLTGWRGDDVVVLAQVPGIHAVSVRDVALGQHGHLHARASGKLLISVAPPDKRERIVSAMTYESFTPGTITDRAALERELDAAQRQRFAVDDEEFSSGISCVAGLADVAGQHFAFSVLAPVERFNANRDAYISAVRDVAEAASTRF